MSHALLLETQPPDSSSKTSPQPLKKQSAAAGEARETRRTASLSDWMKTILPSHRPERGGTSRSRGYWEMVDFEDAKEGRQSRRRVTNSHQSRQSETADSDCLVRWNTAKDLPQSLEASIKPQGRATSTRILPSKSLAADGSRSWAPPGEEAERASNTRFTNRAFQVGQKEKLNSDTIQGDDVEAQAILAARRRLSHARRTIESDKETRRRRQRLKESGDYLGPQGINPKTGEMDIHTPTDSEESAVNQELLRNIYDLRQQLEESGSSYKPDRNTAKGKLKRLMEAEEKRLQKRRREKETLKRAVAGHRWRRYTKQWSSVQEPDLSPIAQSHWSTNPASSQPRPLSPCHLH